MNTGSTSDGKLRKRRHKSMAQPSSSDSSTQNLDDFLQSAYSSSSSRKWQRQWKYWCVILSCGVANSSDASEILCLSYMLSDKTFSNSILQNTPWRGGLLAAAVFLGMLLGGLLLGTLGDWVGRRPVLLLGLACNSVAGMLSAVAPNVYIMSMLRCVAGVGIGATVPPLFTLVTELAPPSQRGFCVTLVASFWMVGSIFVALTAMLMFERWQLSWRLFAMACAIPSLLGFGLCYKVVPESPRFLALQQQHEAALDVANFLARQMNSSSPATLTLEDLRQAFPPKQTTNTLYHHSNFSWLGIVRLGFKKFVSSARQLYTPQLRPTTWPLQMVWFSLSFGSYGLVTWINTLFVEVHLHNIYFNALLFAASNLPGNIITAIWLDKIGRGKMLTGSVIAAATSLLTFAASAFYLNSFGVVASACAFQCFTVAAWNTIDVMTTELFPTTVRSSGMGMCSASGRIGAMVAQFVNGALVANPVRLLLVASATLLLGAMTPSLLPGGGDMTGQPVNDFAETDTSAHRPLLQEESYQFTDSNEETSRKNIIV